MYNIKIIACTQVQNFIHMSILVLNTELAALITVQQFIMNHTQHNDEDPEDDVQDDEDGWGQE